MEFKVGFNRQTVNPDESVPLAGYVNDDKRFHTSQADDICATCVAISDGDATVLVIGFDVTVAGTEFSQLLRQRLEKETGIPQDRMLLAGTHTHAGPGLGEQKLQTWFPEIERYWVKFANGVSEAARLAIADLKPARIFTGSVETESLNFVKHYKARHKVTGEISYIGDNFGDEKNTTVIDHATKGDPTLHVVKFVRDGGRDVVLSNFRGHPHFDGGFTKYILSPSFIGPFRRALESIMDCDVLYLQGASGNVNTTTRLGKERRYTCAQSHGMALAAYAAECMYSHMKEVEPGPIRNVQVEFWGERAKVDESLLEIAYKVSDLWDETADRQKCIELGMPYGIRSPFLAHAIIGHSHRKDIDYRMVLNAVAVGDFLSIVTFPGELFDSLSERIEEDSPFQTTLVMGYAHHQIGYMPTLNSYKYTSYETDITRFAPGTGEKVVAKYVEMLNGLK